MGSEITAEKIAYQRRLRELSRYILRGMTNPLEISDATGWPVEQVSRDIRRMTDRWRREQVKNIEQTKARLINALDLVQSQAWGEWERSKENAITVVKTERPVTVTLSDGTETRTTEVEIRTTAQGQCGDPSYLSQISSAVDKQANILGLKIKKIATTDSNGQDMIQAQVMQQFMKLAEEIGLGVEVVDVNETLRGFSHSDDNNGGSNIGGGGDDDDNVIDVVSTASPDGSQRPMEGQYDDEESEEGGGDGSVSSGG